MSEEAPKPKGKGGRPKGSRNRTTLAVKDATLRALRRLGGVRYLVRLGNEQPEIFVRLVERLLPRELDVKQTLLESARTPTDDLLAAQRIAFILEKGLRAAREQQAMQRRLLPAVIDVEPESPTTIQHEDA